MWFRRDSKVRAMSDSMAFLAGTAFAGIAALLLLKGGGTPAQIYPPNSLPPPPPALSSSNTPLPPPPLLPAQTSSNTEQQRYDMERLKAQMDQQKTDIEQLKAQIQNQQMLIQTLSAQAKVNALSSPNYPNQGMVSVQQPANPMLSGILWALGGAIVTVMGGIVLAAAITLLSQQQRPSRTVQLIHPLNDRPTYLPPKRRKRAEPNEYYEE